MNILRLSKYIIYTILILSVIWFVCKKTESPNTLEPGESQSNDISGFDRVMIGVTGIMEEINPSSSFTRQMTKHKNTIINHL